MKKATNNDSLQNFVFNIKNLFLEFNIYFIQINVSYRAS